MSKTYLYLLNTVLLFVLIGFSLLGFGQSPSQMAGLLRVTLKEFPYVQDPAGMDCRSYEKLQAVSYYVLRIYPAIRVKRFADLKAWEKKLGGKVDYYPSESDQYVGIIVRTSDQLLQEDQKSELLRYLAKGNPLGVMIPTNQLPDFVDIPVPAGTYWIEYSLRFKNAKNPHFVKVHPNYPSRDGGTSDLAWGPPHVVSQPGQQVRVEFVPSHNINFYEYPDSPEKWDGTQAFYDWLDYLDSKGELDPNFVAEAAKE